MMLLRTVLSHYLVGNHGSAGGNYTHLGQKEPVIILLCEDIKQANDVGSGGATLWQSSANALPVALPIF